MSGDLASDVKDLKYGYNRDYSFETCHRGISPFAVASVSSEAASYRRRAQDRAARATQLTLHDITEMESKPGPCPTGYDGLLRQLAAYIRLLQELTGPLSNHYVETRELRRTLIEHQELYQYMTPDDVAQVLWAVFLDARMFFSDTSQMPLPQSQLRFMRSWLLTGTVKKSINCPVDKLLGRAALPIRQSSGASEMSSLSGASIFTPAAVSRGSSEASGGSVKTNPGFKEEFRLATAAVLQVRPNARFNEVMSAADPPLKYSDVRVGAGGSCLDLHYLGRCKMPGCSYRHENIGEPTAERIQRVTPNVRRGVAAYLASVT